MNIKGEMDKFVKHLNNLSGTMRDMLEIGAIAKLDGCDESESGKAVELFKSVRDVLIGEYDVVEAKQPDYYTLMTRGYYMQWDRRNLSAYYYYYLIVYKIWEFFKGETCMNFMTKRAAERHRDFLRSTAEKILALCCDILNSCTIGVQSEAMFATEEEMLAYGRLISGDLSFVCFGTEEGEQI